MKLGTRLLTVLAAAGLMALPVSTSAQSTTPSPQSGQSGTSTSSTQSGTGSQAGQDQASSASNRSPVYYLDQAKKDLDNLSSSARDSDAGKDLARHFGELRLAYEREAGTASTGTASGTAGTAGSASSSSTSQSGGTEAGKMAPAGDTWRTHFSRIEQVLDSLSIPKSPVWKPATGSESGSTESSGSSTSGTAGSSSGTTSGTSGTGSTGSTGGTASAGTTPNYSSASLSAADLAQLKQFREDIEMFYQTMSGRSSQ